jgi:GNAT superfamily N-acetyltransferase
MRDDSAVSEQPQRGSAPDLHFAVCGAGEPPASTLIDAMVEELEAFYGRIDRPGMPSATPADFAPPGGVCLVGSLDGEPVCVGAVKRLDDGLAEIKRMYVAPAGRSRGVARALLVALEDAARGLGYARVRLDTGERQPHARALYLSAGYREIPDYNGNPAASFWGEKPL